jgi:transcriptional regulator with XRE-family HTH domain
LASTDGGIRIGARLRDARRARGLTIDQVAGSTGLTKGFISQLERDQANASVASLIGICDALRIRVGALFEPSRTDLVRAEDRPRINFGGRGVTEYLLTPDRDGRIQVIESLIEPGGEGGEELYSLPSEAEFVHVMRGDLEVVVHDQVHHLSTGDSLTFHPRDPHTWRNPSKRRVTHVLWVLAPSPW